MRRILGRSSRSRSSNNDASDNNRASSSMQTSENIKQSQPQPKRVAFFDVLTFGVVACVIFFINLTQRSIIFDVVLSGALLVKVLIGLFFYKQNNARALRVYFLWRYLYNIFVIYPLIVILRYFTATYVLNYFLAGGITLLFEIIITACYLKHLCFKSPIENIEDIPGFSIKSIRNDNMTVMHIKSVKTGDYLIKSYGKKTYERIVQKQLKQQEEIIKKKNEQNKIKSGKGMTKIQQLEHRKQMQSKARIGFNLIRSEEEIEAEIEYEEIVKAKQENQNTYMTFEDRMSRNVVNDIVLIENAPQQKEKIQQVQDAREDIEKEREKMRRAFQQKGGSSLAAGNDNADSNQKDKVDDLEKGMNNQQQSDNKKKDNIPIYHNSQDKSQSQQQQQSNSNQKTTVRDGPSPYEHQDEDVVIDHDDVKLKMVRRETSKNNKQAPLKNDQNSDDTVRDSHHQEEDLEMQTERGLFDNKPSNDSNLKKPVSHSQSKHSSNNRQSAKEILPTTLTTHNSQQQQTLEKKIVKDKQNDDDVQRNSSKSQDQRQSTTSQQKDKNSNKDRDRDSRKSQRQTESNSNNTRSSQNQPSSTQQQQQQQEDKEKDKKKQQITYEEKFEIQRLQNQKKQQQQVTQQQQFSGKHAYAQNKIQKEIQRKAELKRKMEKEKRREEEGGDSSSDSDGSYYSDESPRARKQRKLAKQQKQLQKQKTKKIHGVNDRDGGGDSSSSLSDGEPKQKKNNNNIRKQSQDNGRVNNNQSNNNNNNQKQVRFDENKNTVKQVTNYDHQASSANKGYSHHHDDYGEEYNSEEYSD